MSTIKLVCISDTHNYQKSVDIPACDILIHAGDSTSRGSEHDIRLFGEWLRSLTQCQYKVVISGNHDFGFQSFPVAAKEWLYGEKDYDHRDGLYYLQDEEITLNCYGKNVRIYGSPWQPEFGGWAFNLPRGAKLKEKWDLIPEGLDVLITHGPPYGHCDLTDHGESVGCEELTKAILRTKPKLAVCGHIHEAYGTSELGDTTVANVASCNRRYHPVNPAVVFELDEDGKLS